MNRIQSWTLLKIIVGVVLVTSITVWTYQESTNNQLVWDSYHYLVKYVIEVLPVSELVCRSRGKLALDEELPLSAQSPLGTCGNDLAIFLVMLSL